jgi:hypothetical protein
MFAKRTASTSASRAPLTAKQAGPQAATSKAWPPAVSVHRALDEYEADDVVYVPVKDVTGKGPQMAGKGKGKAVAVAEETPAVAARREAREAAKKAKDIEQAKIDQAIVLELPLQRRPTFTRDPEVAVACLEAMKGCASLLQRSRRC